MLFCKACDSRHDFLPLDSILYQLTWDKSIQLGQCFLKDRWIIDLKQTTCKFYALLGVGMPQPMCMPCVKSDFASPCEEPKGTCKGGFK